MHYRVRNILFTLSSGYFCINSSYTFFRFFLNVSKRAIEDLTIALAKELEEKGIQVNCVSPSDTATSAYNKYFPQYMDDAIAPELIAQKIAELCNEENTTSGKVIVMKKDVEAVEGFHV